MIDPIIAEIHGARDDMSVDDIRRLMEEVAVDIGYSSAEQAYKAVDAGEIKGGVEMWLRILRFTELRPNSAFSLMHDWYDLFYEKDEFNRCSRKSYQDMWFSGVYYDQHENTVYLVLH